MARTVSVAEAKAKLSALMAEVAFGRERIMIEKRGKALAALVSIAELECLERERVVSPRPTGALALVGLWKDVSDEEIDRLLSDIYDARARNTAQLDHNHESCPNRSRNRRR